MWIQRELRYFHIHKYLTFDPWQCVIVSDVFNNIKQSDCVFSHLDLIYWYTPQQHWMRSLLRSILYCIWNILNINEINIKFQLSGVQPRSWTCSESKVSLPFLPKPSKLGNWHTNFVTMSDFFTSEIWYQHNFLLLSLTSTLLPSTLKTQKFTMYLGKKHLLV